MRYEDGKKIYWKLIKPLYGLNDAARRWWKKLDNEMLSRGCSRVIYDKAVYTNTSWLILVHPNTS